MLRNIGCYYVQNVMATSYGDKFNLNEGHELLLDLVQIYINTW